MHPLLPLKVFGIRKIWENLGKFFKNLSKKLSDVLGGQGAAVSDLAQLGVLDHLADLGGGGEVKLGGNGGNLGVEKGQDLVGVGDGTGSHVADQPAVALGGFGVGQDGEGGVLAAFGVTAASAGDGGAEDESLEEGHASQEGEGGGGGGREGHGGAGSGGGSGADDEGAGGHVGEGHEGKRSGEDGVHAVKLSGLRWVKMNQEGSE